MEAIDAALVVGKIGRSSNGDFAGLGFVGWGIGIDIVRVDVGVEAAEEEG